MEQHRHSTHPVWGRFSNIFIIFAYYHKKKKGVEVKVSDHYWLWKEFFKQQPVISGNVFFFWIFWISYPVCSPDKWNSSSRTAAHVTLALSTLFCVHELTDAPWLPSVTVTDRKEFAPPTQTAQPNNALLAPGRGRLWTHRDLNTWSPDENAFLLPRPSVNWNDYYYKNYMCTQSLCVLYYRICPTASCVILCKKPTLLSERQLDMFTWFFQACVVLIISTSSSLAIKKKKKHS